MKVYHIYNELGEWATVTQNFKAVERKLKGVQTQSQAGGGGKVWEYFDEDVPDDWVPKAKKKPATGCKKVML